MPTLRTPLVGSYNNRSFGVTADIGKDQYSTDAIITPIGNKQSRTATYYTEKRSGFQSNLTPGSGATPQGVYVSPSSRHIYSVFGNHVWDATQVNATIDCGVIDAGDYVFSEAIINGVTCILIACAINGIYGSTGWVLPADATGTLTFTGTTHSNTTMDGIASTTGMYAGQAISGSGIPANTRIAAVNSGVAITLTIAATTSTTATFTRSAVAKIIDADFPTDIVGGFVELDGYIGIMSYTGRFYNSDLNTFMSWAATGYLTCSKYSDAGRCAARCQNMIAAFSVSSLEFLWNAGNPTGSPFSSSDRSVGARTIPPQYGSSIAQANGTLYWVGNDNNIYAMEGFSPKKISTNGLERMSDNVSVNTGAYVTAFSYNRKTYINIYGVSKTFWYCVDDDTWTQTSVGTGATYAADGQGNFTYYTIGSITGKIFILPSGHDAGYPPVFQDNGSAYTMTVQIATDMGTQNCKQATELRLVGDVQSSGTLDISYSDDDGATYSTARSMPLTSIAEMRITRLGSWYGSRLWKFQHSANTPFRAKQIEIDYTEGV